MNLSALDVIEREHAELQGLFAHVSDPQANRAEVLKQLLRRMAAHVSIERSELFPIIKDRQIGGDHGPDEQLQEYDEIQRMLVLVERRKANSPDVPDMLNKMLHVFDRHCQQWDAVIIPGLRRLLDPAELEELGERMRSAEGVIVSHPHPHLLSLGPVSRFTTRLAGLVDRLRDRTVTNK